MTLSARELEGMAKGGPRSLLSQAMVRLGVALAAAALLATMVSVWYYEAAYTKARQQKSGDNESHFVARIADLEYESEVDALRVKARLEFMGFLNDPAVRWLKLHSYLTAQSGSIRFSNLLVGRPDGKVVFRYGEGSENLPSTLAMDRNSTWYYSPQNEVLYHIYRVPLWLGMDGMASLYLFKAMDNALLFRSAYPGTDLFLEWRGKIVASSLGEVGKAEATAGKDVRTVVWDWNAAESPLLVIHNHIAPPFSVGEAASAAGVLVVAFAVLSWFALGHWLTRVARRVLALEGASRLFSQKQALSGKQAEILNHARDKGGDELARVADSLDDLMHTVVRRNEERRLHEAELRERERKLRSYFNLSQDPILVMDQEGHIQEANPAACRMFGYSEGELTERAVWQLVASDETNLAASRRHFEDLAREGRSRGEVVHLTKSGEALVFDVNAVDLGDGHYLGVLRDTTERHRMEQLQARHMAELARINAELDEFTYVASHDLQEPLRKLVSFSALLERDLGKELASPVATDLRFITESAHRMRNLVQDLLTLSRAGKSAMKRERLALDFIADRALENLETTMAEKGAVVERDTLPEVWGDATLLTQLYQNLVGNGLKYVEGVHPVIRLTAERSPEGTWVFGVKDNGIGIRGEYAQQIFQPFKRLHTQGEYEGTGIGLAICRKVVERHGGQIWVESEEGRGSHFKFALGGA